MDQSLIFIPFFGMMLLTIAVWFYMYILRLQFLKGERVNPQSVATTKQMQQLVPDRIALPSENLSNLFELPVLFYAVCLYLYVTQQVDLVYLILAWTFLLFRILHSLIHCTYNKVLQRFYSYFLASVILWLMILRAIYGLFTQ